MTQILCGHQCNAASHLEYGALLFRPIFTSMCIGTSICFYVLLRHTIGIYDIIYLIWAQSYVHNSVFIVDSDGPIWLMVRWKFCRKTTKNRQKIEKTYSLTTANDYKWTSERNGCKNGKKMIQKWPKNDPKMG